jgi:hypothetical protein
MTFSHSTLLVRDRHVLGAIGEVTGLAPCVPPNAGLAAPTGRVFELL